ncbi:MAG TPA: hypothetical protein PL009_00480 [Flavipsychrobacter sp.]|nr:hypothetical protein [Flavipsychrobacter sp.]
MERREGLKKIVLVSSGQPGGNPRLVKEATALSEAGYAVTVIYCRLSPWADAYDEELFHKYPEIHWIAIGYHPFKDKWRNLAARLRQKIYKNLNLLLSVNPTVAIRSMVLYSQELTAAAKKHKADLYIGHNLGALPAVVAAAKKHKALATFDFEDYHRGEDKEGSLHWRNVKIVEDSLVPHLACATAASPLIADAYKEHYPSLEVTNINNCFPLKYRGGNTSSLPASPLKLFWFSQFVGKNRGLETVIEAIGKPRDRQVSLSLLGNADEEIKSYFLDLGKSHGLRSDQIVFLSPVSEAEIVKTAAQHHIGLACEVPHIMNRELCLTNKIFMYLLAGNAIVFTNTKAQQNFLEEHPEIGKSYDPHNAEQLANILNHYVEDDVLLKSHRGVAYKLGVSMNWDSECKIFLNEVKKALS